jgi:N-acetylmuramoyl-L-alanine amidase CwlA
LTNHGSYWLNGSHSTSIHFTVGDYGVIQDLDTRYIAHHAGDGTGTTFSFNDTGIAANGNLNPEIAISPDGYFTFNGVNQSY